MRVIWGMRDFLLLQHGFYCLGRGSLLGSPVSCNSHVYPEHLYLVWDPRKSVSVSSYAVKLLGIISVLLSFLRFFFLLNRPSNMHLCVAHLRF